MKGQSVTADRSRTIDGLRGIAAMAVIVQHCIEFTPIVNTQPTFASPIQYLFANDFNLGRFGVIIFFLISGYLIPSSIGHQPRSLISFAIGRFFRLYPLYWLSLILALFAIAALGEKVPGVASIVANLTMIQTLFGYKNILDPYWTLLVEHLFYASCVIFFLFGALRHRREMRRIMWAGGLGLIALAVAVARMPRVSHESPISQLMSLGSFIFIMIVGHNIRLAQTARGFEFPKEAVALAVIVFACITGARQLAGVDAFLLSPLAIFLSTISGLLLFLFALRSGLFRAAVFEFTGRISYGLYLFHAIALWIALALVRKPTDIASSLLLLALVLGMTFAISTVTYYVLEEPFIALGKTIRRRHIGKDDGVREEPSSLGRTISPASRDALEPFNKSAMPTDMEGQA